MLFSFSLQDVEIKKMSGNATYGFVLFYDLMDAVAAKQCMDGELVRGNKIRVCGCVCLSSRVCVCVSGRVCVCTCISGGVYVCVCASIYVCIYMYQVCFI